MIPIAIPFDESQHPAQLADVAFDRGPLVIFVSQSMFKPNARVFGDLKDLKAIKPVRHALQMVAQVVRHPELCDGQFLSRDPLQLDMIPKWYVPSEGAVPTHAKTRQFVEAVYAPDLTTVIGWRWFVFGNDACVDFGTGIQNLIHLNAVEYRKAQRQRGRPGPGPTAAEGYKRSVLTPSQWAYGVCDTYLNRRQLSLQKAKVHDGEHPISSTSNPANPHLIFTMERAVHIRGANAAQSSVLGYKRRDDDSMDDGCLYRFPLPEHVWELESEHFNPGVLMQMEFPTQKRRAAQSPLRDLCLFQTQCDGGEYTEQILDIMEATHGFVRSDFVFNRQSDLSLLEQIASKLLARDMPKHQGEAAKQQFLSDFKVGLMEDFAKFWCSESHISGNIKHMLAWEEQQRLDAEERNEAFTMTVPQYPLDTAMSPFANLMMRRMVQYEKLLKTSTVHRELFITLVATRDAYRRSFDLHTNPLLAGAGSSSKSYILNQVEKLSIKGTVQTVTHITAKADAIDENQNDIITLFHEMPKSLMGFDEIGTTGDPMFKERLTSNKFKTKLFCLDEETGKRSNRIAESECIGVIGGCTNDPPGKIPEALRSRFLMIMCPQIVRKGHEVIDQFGSAPDPTLKRMRQAMVHEHHCEQYLLCIVHKLIWTKVLCEVNLNIAHTIFRNVLQNLEDEGIRSKDPRQYTRLENTARTLTIMNAIHTVLNTPGGALYNKPFVVSDLFALEPYLLCTEEIAYFTISLLQDMYINPAERHVASTVAEMTKYSPDMELDEFEAWRKDYQGNDDRNYVAIKADHTFMAASKIASLMRKNKSSLENVNAILFDLAKRTIGSDDRNSLGAMKAGWQRWPIFELDRSAKMAYVSVAWLDRVLDPAYANTMQKAIRDTFHAHSRARTILLGESFLAVDMPHIWQTMDVVPNPQHHLFVRNTGYKTQFEQSCLYGTDAGSEHVLKGAHPSYRIDHDIEITEFLQHLDDIGIGDHDQQDQSALPLYTEEALREDFPMVPQGIYPERLKAEYRLVLAQHRDGQGGPSYASMRSRDDGTARQLQPRKRLRSAVTDPPSSEAATAAVLDAIMQ